MLINKRLLEQCHNGYLKAYEVPMGDGSHVYDVSLGFDDDITCYDCTSIEKAYELYNQLRDLLKRFE